VYELMIKEVNNLVISYLIGDMNVWCHYTLLSGKYMHL